MKLSKRPPWQSIDGQRSEFDSNLKRFLLISSKHSPQHKTTIATHDAGVNNMYIFITPLYTVDAGISHLKLQTVSIGCCTLADVIRCFSVLLFIHVETLQSRMQVFCVELTTSSD